MQSDLHLKVLRFFAMTAAETGVPMDITMQNPAECGVLGQEAPGSEPPAAPSAWPPNPPIFNEDKVLVSVEVLLKPSSTAPFDDVRSAVESMLEKRSMSYADGSIPVPVDNSFLVDNVQRICICDTDVWVEKHDILLFWQVRPVVHVFQLSEEGPCEELNNDGQLASFNEWILPAKEFDGMWESLIYESGLKQRLLRYAASALLFTDKGVNPFLVSWNRIVLLHGPPGTGKTSLCKALAQKLSICFSSRYPQCQLIEVNAHSLFSKWFSESGKLVAKLFSKIQEMVEEENNLVFVLIDEVESLAAARKAALSGSEPSDSIRVVNALLTQMDKLKSSPNVIILTTSNITAAIGKFLVMHGIIHSVNSTSSSSFSHGFQLLSDAHHPPSAVEDMKDIAFVDRADIKAYVGPPTLQARYEILRSGLLELLRTGILSDSQDGDLFLQSFTSLKEQLNSTTEATESASPLNLCKQLLEVAEACEGLSGRSLRKLPFLAHAALANPCACGPDKFLRKMIETAKRECSEMPD